MRICVFKCVYVRMFVYEGTCERERMCMRKRECENVYEEMCVCESV